MKLLFPMALASAALLAGSAQAQAAGDATAGKKAFAQCAVCHSVVAGQNRVGPSLAGVAGRKIAAYPKFNYSAALKAKTGNWTDANLNTWITKPMAWAPGTRMAFAGIADAKRRADVIAYLKTLK
jgi:cytochrome c